MAAKALKARSFRDRLIIGVNLIADALDRFELYNSLKSPSHRKDFASVFASYPHFFGGIIPSVFESFIVKLYKLGETRSDTVNVVRLIDDALEEKVISKTVADTLKSKFKAVKPTWIKVCTIRNEMVGHTSESLTVREVLEKAAATPSQLEKLTATYAEILGEIGMALGFPELKHKTYSNAVAAETKKLLTRLKD